MAGTEARWRGRALGFALLLLVGATPVPSAASWVNACERDSGINYCKNLGKGAYNRKGHPALRAIRLGTIVGVAWRPKGSMIGGSLATSVRVSERDAYYYIIDDGREPEPFLRQGRDIEAK